MKVKKVLYLDLDGVCIDFHQAVRNIDPHADFSYGGANEEEKKRGFKKFAVDNPQLFETAPLMEGAKEAFEKLTEYFDVYFLSTPVWDAPSSYTAKAISIKENFGELAFQRLILSHHKHLCHGAILVDDTYNNGADKFTGNHILFGSEAYPNWEVTLKKLIELA